MKRIKLGTGTEFAIVDDSMHDWLSNWKWSLTWGKGKWDHTKYAFRTFRYNRKYYSVAMHRAIIQAPNGLQVDHINGNGLDNRIENLRLCTPQENQFNARIRNRGTSDILYKGVYRIRNRFQAKIGHNYKQIHLGVFDTQEEAAKAYTQALDKLGKGFGRQI